jgi:hypothetical protein
MAGKALDLDATGASGDQQGLSVASVAFGSTAAVNNAANTITLTAHGFTTGDAVAYSAEGGGEDIGLSEGVTYYVHVVDANTVQFKADPGDMDVVDLTPTAGGSLHSLNRLRLFDAATDVNNATDAVTLTPGHGLMTGDSVIYGVGAADAALSKVTTAPLVEGGTYYVILDGSDKVKLSATMGGPALDLSNLGASGKLQQLFSGMADDGLFDPAADVDNAANTITLEAKTRYLSNARTK